MPRIKLLYALMIAGIALCLLQIWLPQYYLTGDGPCHTYNAHVLHDLWNGTDIAFYSRFYTINYDPNPNWMSHILLGLPMYFVSGVVAEKIFLTLYAAILIGGFYLLIKKVSGSSSYWITIIFLFVYQHTLAKGFYNFTLGTAFYFWLVWSWLNFMKRRTTINTLAFFLITGLTFFTQLLPFVFGIFTCFALALSHLLAKERADSELPVNHFLKNIITLGLLIAPFLALMFWFTNKEGGTHIRLAPHLYRLIQLVQFNYAISATRQESYFTAIAGITIAALTVAAIVLRVKKKEGVHKYDGIFFSLIFVLFVYIFFPEDFMQRAILISMRAQLYVLALAALFIAYTLPQQVKNACGWILFTCFVSLSFVRIGYMTKASAAAADYNSVSAYIKPYSVVLPLDFSPAGQDENGHTIATYNYLFSHTLQYAGCEKPLIMLDNYEANAGYFPLQWTLKTNPYKHLSRHGGIEGQPPGAGIAAYKAATGVSIDYIVMWCYNPSFLHNDHYKELDEEIHNMYHLAYTSPSGRTLLYEKNK